MCSQGKEAQDSDGSRQRHTRVGRGEERKRSEVHLSLNATGTAAFDKSAMGRLMKGGWTSEQDMNEPEQQVLGRGSHLSSVLRSGPECTVCKNQEEGGR